MSEELLARIDQLEAQLAEVRNTAERANDRALSAHEYAEGVEVRADDYAGEVAYQRERADRAEERIETAILDIQGVNLEQRITEVLLSKINDGTFTTVEVVEAEQDSWPEVAEGPLYSGVPISAPPVRSPSTSYVQHTFDMAFPSGGTHPVVESEGNDLSERESEYVALDESPDEGAGQSETVSPDEVEDENY